MAAGDDWTDENMFQALPEEAVTVKVGIGPTSAQYLVKEQQDLMILLEKFLQARSVITYFGRRCTGLSRIITGIAMKLES